jgi:hypothetical protein
MPVIQLSLDGKYLDEYESIGMTKEKGYTPQHVHSCCRGKLKSHKGFIWMFKKN